MSKYMLILTLIFGVCGCGVNPAERNNSGNALYAQARYEDAIRAYQAAQVASPDSPEAYYNSGAAYSQVGAFDKSIEAFKKALNTTDIDLRVRTYFNLGNIYFQMRRFEDAVNAYQQVLLFRPDEDDARHNLELALKQLIIVSPTLSQSFESTENGNKNVTPTGKSSENNSAFASPTLLTNITLTPFASLNEAPPTLSVEDAEHILDAVQQAQQLFSPGVISGTPAPVQSSKEW